MILAHIHNEDHWSEEKTLKEICKEFNWKNITKDVEKFIRVSPTCAKVKNAARKFVAPGVYRTSLETL